MKILSENILIPELENDLSNMKGLLSLGASLGGFREISGASLSTSIEAAMQLIEELKSQDYGDADEADIKAFNARCKSQIDAYLERARQEAATLKTQATQLSQGSDLATKIVKELFAINNKL